MSDWLTDPQLFLYATGTGPDDVVLRRCKKPVSSSSSSLVVPMKSDDFDYVSNVKNHMELIGDQFDWDETDYERLVKYIYERLLLVNRQGLVIAEIYKLDDVNEVPIYIRSLDVLPLKPYIPNIRERLIPLRTVKYLEDVNGKAAAMMEENDSNVIIELTARVDDLETKNKTLDTNVTKLTAGLAIAKGENKTLDSNVRTMEGKVTKLTADLATAKGENKTLDTNVTKLTARQVAMNDKVDDLESKNKTLEGKVTKLTADLVIQMNALTNLQQEMKNSNANTKEVWMNDLTNSEWVGVEGLRFTTTYDELTIAGSLGSFTVDDSSTNIRARYWYKVQVYASSPNNLFKAVCLEDFTPNKERARFSQAKWWSIKSKGKTYLLGGSC